MPPSSAESEARKALNRLVRSVEKALREMDTLEGALRHAEGDDFPQAEYDDLRASLSRAMEFAEEEGLRLQRKVLETGGLEPGRVRRGS